MGFNLAFKGLNVAQLFQCSVIIKFKYEFIGTLNVAQLFQCSVIIRQHNP